MNLLELLASLAAACAHDVGHDGLNNQFHINGRTVAAIRWNDCSVLENLHASLAFELLFKYENNWLHTFNDDDQSNIRSLMVKLILATDNNNHHMHQENIVSLANKLERQTSVSNAVTASESTSLKDVNEITASICSEAHNKSILLKAAMHLADISNPAKPNSIAVY